MEFPLAEKLNTLKDVQKFAENSFVPCKAPIWNSLQVTLVSNSLPFSEKEKWLFILRPVARIFARGVTWVCDVYACTCITKQG